MRYNRDGNAFSPESKGDEILISNSDFYMLDITKILKKYICDDACYHWHKLCVMCSHGRACQQNCGKNLNQWQLAEDYKRDTDNFDCEESHLKPKGKQ